jgi:hypothetical protein
MTFEDAAADRGLREERLEGISNFRIHEPPAQRAILADGSRGVKPHRSWNGRVEERKRHSVAVGRGMEVWDRRSAGWPEQRKGCEQKEKPSWGRRVFRFGQELTAGHL